jgi:hypothetical protein
LNDVIAGYTKAGRDLEALGRGMDEKKKRQRKEVK